MKKYYQVYGDKSAVFSFDAEIPIERVLKIMRVKRIKEISYPDYLSAPKGNLKYDLEKLKRLSKCKTRRLTYK